MKRLLQPIAHPELPWLPRLNRLAALAVAMLAGVVLLGYGLHEGRLVDLAPNWQGMSPTTAVALLVLALSALFEGDGRRAAARTAGWIALLLGIGSLGILIVYGRDILNPLIAARGFLFNAARAGLTSAATAIGIIALAGAALTRVRPRLSDAASASALVIAGFAVLGYAYGVDDLYAVPLFGNMALHTALAMAVLALVSMTVRADSGWAAVVASTEVGGAMTRRLLAFALVPPIAGYLLVATTGAHRLGVGAAMAVLVVLTVVPLCLLILRDADARDALIRERRAKAAMVRAGDREMRLVADAMPVLIAFLDTSYTYRFANKAYEDWFGLPPDKVIGRRVMDLLPAEEFEIRRGHIEQALAGREAHFELPWPHLDGRAREAEIRYMPRTTIEGTIDGIYIFVVDITDRKGQERRLVAENEKLGEVVVARTRERDQIWQASTDLLCVASHEGFFHSLNPAWTATLGWSEEELLAKPFLDFVHQDDIAQTLDAARRLATGEAQTNFENRYRHKVEGYRWLSWNAVPRDGMIYASVRDVTEAKEAETRQRSLEEQLRQSQKMEAVGQLTGGIAHDFNNLLTGITGGLDLVSARLSQGRTDGLDRYIDAAQGAAKRAAALTHRLLAFSRRQTLDPKPTDANRLVADMEDLIRRTAGPAVTVEIVAGDGLWATMVDQNQLENALLNLCINARDAMPDGGRIAIETSNIWLDARKAREHELAAGQYVSVAVTDDGSGMPPEVIERVFDPFFTTKPLGQGTGLGLSMIYGFVRQSGGQVDIASEVGRGTTMRLYLPRHYGAAAAEEQPAKLASMARSDREQTVLIIDDEATVRMLVTDVLEELGYRAIEAADGAGGLEVLHSDIAIDLLVTDVGLPGGINGRQVADAGRGVRPDLKVLFITGYAEASVLGDGELGPGTRVLTKPFPMEALGRVIGEMTA